MGLVCRNLQLVDTVLSSLATLPFLKPADLLDCERDEISYESLIVIKIFYLLRYIAESFAVFTQMT